MAADEPTYGSYTGLDDIKIRQDMAKVVAKVVMPAFQKKGKKIEELQALILDDNAQPDPELVDQAINRELRVIKHYLLGLAAEPEFRGTSKMDMGAVKKDLAGFYRRLGIERPKPTAEKFVRDVQMEIFGRLATNNPEIRERGQHERQ